MYIGLYRRDIFFPPPHLVVALGLRGCDFQRLKKDWDEIFPSRMGLFSACHLPKIFFFGVVFYCWVSIILSLGVCYLNLLNCKVCIDFETNISKFLLFFRKKRNEKMGTNICFKLLK